MEFDDFPALVKQENSVLGYLCGAADAVSRADGKTTQPRNIGAYEENWRIEEWAGVLER